MKEKITFYNQSKKKKKIQKKFLKKNTMIISTKSKKIMKN